MPMPSRDPHVDVLGATLATGTDPGAVQQPPASAETQRGSERPLPRPNDLAPGTRINRYVIEGRLGAGAMGIVYVAHDPELDRRVALKLIRSAARFEGLRARLYREAQALARVQHPNVVVVYEVDVYGDQVYVAMELVRGGTLRDWLEKPQPLDETLRVLREAGRGLAAAHAAELVHRDFKPDNVLIGEDGRARVTDFGLARAGGDMEGDEPRTGTPVTSPLYEALTQTGMMVGTPVYASPEQLAGERVGPASDQFAFCVTAFEALYGKRPFDAPELAELRAKVSSQQIEAVSNRDVPRRVHAAIVRGLSPRPEDRWPSMTALIAELEPPRASGKRAWIAGGAGIAAAGIAVAVVAVARSPSKEDAGAGEPPPPTCADKAAQIDKVWNAALAKELHEKMLASKAPLAERRYKSFDVWVTRYANAWRAARTTACTQQGSGSGDDATRTTLRCLDARYDTFADIVGQDLADPRTANVHMLELMIDPVATCTQTPGALRSEKFDEVRRLRFAIVDTQRMWIQGQHEAAHTKIEQLLSTADAFGYAPLRAEILIMGAQLSQGDQDATKAEKQLRKALTYAESAADDRTKTVAATRLTLLLADRHDGDEAAQMLELADAAYARNGVDISLEPDLVYARGCVAAEQKRYAEAARLLEEARELYEATALANAGATFRLAAVYRALGREADAKALMDKLMAATTAPADPWADQNPAIAAGADQIKKLEGCRADENDPLPLTERRDKCREVVLDFEKVYGIGSMTAAEPHYFLALILEMLDDNAGAHEEYRKAIMAWETHANYEKLAQGLEFAGRTSLELGEVDRAIAELTRGLEAAKTAGKIADEDRMYITGTLGRAQNAKKDYKAALESLTPTLTEYIARKASLASIARVRFELAKARWERNGPDDRAQAKLDARTAMRELEQHRALYKPDTDVRRRFITTVDRQLAKIKAWLDSH